MTEPLVIKFNTPFEAAVKAAEARHVVMPDEYYDVLPASMRSRAFTVSYIPKLEQISQIMASLQKAMVTGTSFDSWRKDLGGIEQFGISKAHAETVFRNAIQTHYAVGHWESFQRTKKLLPYLRYSAINDSRTSECCKALSGIIRRVDDPFWATHTPPNHHRCILPWTKITGDFEIGLKSHYSGEVVEIITKSGMRLAVTANHPVMSNNGWVCANAIKKGDRLLRHTGVGNVMFSGIVDNQNPPARADDVFDSLTSDAFGFVDISAFKFHDDAHLRKSKVYVAGFDCVLMNGFKSASLESIKQWQFKITNHFASRRKLNAFCTPFVFKFNVTNSVFRCNPFNIADRAVIFTRNLDCAFTSLIRRNYNSFKFIVLRIGNLPSRTKLTLNKFWGFFDCFPLQGFGFTSSSTGNTLITQTSSNNIPTNTDSFFNRLNAFASKISLCNFNFINICTRFSSFSLEKCLILFTRTPFNSTVAQQPSEQALTDSIIFKDFCERFANQISVDDVVCVRNFSFSGHVYDFQCKNEVIVAGGIITHNCRSTLQALTGEQASKRSQNGTGLNQDETDLMNPQKGWDYNPALSHDTMLKELAAEKIAKLPEGVVKSTVEKQLKKSHDMKIITLEKFAPVQKAVAELAVKNPHWFPEGFNGIHAVESADMFAGYYQGAFYFSVADELVAGFKPAVDLANAFSKANTEFKLTFTEEYAIETLWHELMHARTGVTTGRLALGMEPLNEGVVQLSARHTYQNLAKEIGVNLTYQEKIISDGLAYPRVTRNLLELIRQANVSGASIENLLLTHGNDYLEPLKELLAIGLNTKRVGTLLNASQSLTLEVLKFKIATQQRNAPLQHKESF